MNEWALVPGFFFMWGIIKIRSGQGFFVPLPMGTVRTMLKMANIKKSDVLYDLGCGDGRVVVEAAKKYGVKAVGIDNSVLPYMVSKLNVRLRGLDSKGNGQVKILNKDFMKHNISEATVIMIYLTPKMNARLKPKFERELKKGTRVVSAAHEMPGWKLQKKIKTGHFWTYLYKV
jgi:16S rRNA A1518/A1519 N6-dimethyltransferase RsmA/KsgA/DIM1 with predicted DNA glycosylase/AP lyase activity